MKLYYPDEQVIKEAEYLIRGYSTYQMARHFHIPQSTAWWHVSVRLRGIDPQLHSLVTLELQRHWTGGGR